MAIGAKRLIRRAVLEGITVYRGETLGDYFGIVETYPSFTLETVDHTAISETYQRATLQGLHVLVIYQQGTGTLRLHTIQGYDTLQEAKANHDKIYDKEYNEV